MKLWTIHIKTYYFGNVEYNVLILAKTKENALQLLYDYPRYRNDEDAEIQSIKEIELNTDEERILNVLI